MTEERTREQLFLDEGLDAETARIAAEASYLSPKERTPKQREAITKASDAIAENCRNLAEAGTEDLSRPGACSSPNDRRKQS